MRTHKVFSIASKYMAISGSGSVVEHLLAKEKVAGSIPVSRSSLIIRHTAGKTFGDVAKW